METSSKNSRTFATSTSVLALALVTLVSITGCYTQVTSDQGDYWGHTGRAKREKVVVVQQAPTYDTVLASNAAPDAVDTVYINDDRSRADNGYQNSQTIVNNYYTTDEGYYDGFYGSPYRSGVTISIGFGRFGRYYDPWGSYYHVYSPYYASSWYDPYDYWYHRGGGRYYDPYYPYPPSPFYSCYAPVYDPFDFYYPYYGRGYYGGGYYGGHGYYGDRDGYRGSGSSDNSNHKIGRIRGGESRGTNGRSSGTGTSVGRGGNNSPSGTRSGGGGRVGRANSENLQVPSTVGVSQTGSTQTGAVQTGTHIDANNLNSGQRTSDGRAVLIGNNSAPTNLTQGNAVLNSNASSSGNVQIVSTPSVNAQSSGTQNVSTPSSASTPQHRIIYVRRSDAQSAASHNVVSFSDPSVRRERAAQAAQTETVGRNSESYKPQVGRQAEPRRVESSSGWSAPASSSGSTTTSTGSTSNGGSNSGGSNSGGSNSGGGSSDGGRSVGRSK